MNVLPYYAYAIQAYRPPESVGRVVGEGEVSTVIVRVFAVTELLVRSPPGTRSLLPYHYDNV